MRSKRLFRVICFALSFGIVSSIFPKDVSAMDKSNRTSGRDYYISSLNGDNSNDGSTDKKAWETLDKLQKVDLQPGDRVLLESGSVFNGFIHLKDVSGTAENPIEITKYGGDVKPIINGNGEGVWYQDYVEPLDNAGHRGKGYVSSTILLYDTDFIKINNLEITNESDDFDYLGEGDKVSQRMDRTGVAGIAKNGGTMESIQLEDLYIHDIDGNIQDKHMNNGGIQMNVLKPDNEAETGIARYQDILIKGCHVKDVSRAGIVVGYTYNHSKFNGAAISDEAAKKYGHTNILIEENYVQNSGNDAIVSMYAYQPVVQKNVSDKAGVDMLDYSYWQNFCASIWPWKTKDAIFQNNEAFDTVGQNNGDGQAWDIDWSDGTIYQYNYSHNNGGGAMLICLNEAYNGVFRYNISQNDLKALITFQGNPLAKIYNNVFYLDGDLTTRIHHPATGNKDSGVGYLANNIFYNTSTGNPNDPWEPSNNKQFTNNIYYGYNSVPSTDKFAITEDPKFVNPGSAPTSTTGKVHDISAFDGYKLQDDSPAINAGVYLSGSGDKDFFGNEIGLIPDIGIHEKNIKDESPVNAIYSNTYSVKDSRIEGVEQKTTVESFLGNFKYSNGVKLEVLNGDSIVEENSFIKNGYKLKVTFVDKSIKEYTIIVDREFIEYSVEGMTAQDGSHQSGNSTEGPGSFALDNNLSTMWHTNWNGCKREEAWISIDMGKVQPISMLKYTPRRSIANGIITKYSIYVKENENDQWTKVETENNVWERSISDKYAYFKTVNARYIKLHAEESYTTTSSIYASAAEIRLGVEKNDQEVR
ncbi:MAG: discoidin domain-containing protein [Clostridium sp.]|jgi:F5/8 type C domain|uniref:discoidin domain-containing protein n=1 Tax=Clostridium TaxID=1485 RepID=UPI0029040016|nr:discoidin domain-containing protein [Clostridium sp.]MBS6500933.1 discoidin domain-containing protein [Clostridium sp.]MDU1278132.1 discoidin domain-containing protein [Clostridium sp.]MDU2459332.1 discoidin domain-containing protein [Clostridium sp.]MDU3349166.1 discoidin domain-containing protein [Clostridium sp.]MDU3407646.1 discoidin domain-containing protein [Clostridium sp.]